MDPSSESIACHPSPRGLSIGISHQIRGIFELHICHVPTSQDQLDPKAENSKTAQKVLMSLVLVFFSLRGRRFFDTPTFENTFIRFRNDEVFHFGLIREKLSFIQDVVTREKARSWNGVERELVIGLPCPCPSFDADHVSHFSFLSISFYSGIMDLG